jgi:dolichyl-phosphate-mannose--protein O-mannosyl transferase
MGTPLIWWSGVFALAITLGYFLYRREKVALLILIGVAANYLPWFFFQKRTMFYFYSIAFQPFLILSIVYVVAKAFEKPEKWRANRGYFYLWSGLVILCFIYFLPLFIGSVLPYDSWYDRMWFPSWI